MTMISRINVTKERLEQLYVRDGLSAPKCAVMLGCAQSSIIRYLQKFGIKGRPKGRFDHRVHGITKATLLNLYIEQGLSERQCAEVLGLPTHGAITERIREFGIKTRPSKFQLGNQLSTVAGGEGSRVWKGGKKPVSCAQCGKRLVRFPSLINRNNFCRSDCRKKWLSAQNALAKNPNWRGGTSFEPYPTTWTFHLREMIRERDDRTCQVCGEKENGTRLAVHHIDYDKANISPPNLITLCRKCHTHTNYRREEWTKFFLGGAVSIQTRA
jgi:hypothetical protein